MSAKNNNPITTASQRSITGEEPTRIYERSKISKFGHLLSNFIEPGQHSDDKKHDSENITKRGDAL